MSDSDCELLSRKCGACGITVGELIQSFIGDLIDGTYSNGSDERMYANQWFDRCGFGMYEEPTLLSHLLCEGYNPEDYLYTFASLKDRKEDIEITKKHIAEAGDEWKNHVHSRYSKSKKCCVEEPAYNSVEEYIASERDYLEQCERDLIDREEELEDMREDWKPEKEPNMGEEIELIKKWVFQKELLMAGKEEV